MDKKKQKQNRRFSLSSPNQELEWNVTPEDCGNRLDKYVMDCLQNQIFSRSQIQEWIRMEAIKVNGQGGKASTKLAIGDKVRLDVPELKPLELVPEKISLPIVYEDKDLIVINKPRGLVVHPAPGHLNGTLVNALLHHCHDLSGINGVLRPGIVHRIDKDTSGLLVSAKNDFSHISLALQFKAHTVVRKYEALVHGVVPHDKGTIDAPIGRLTSDRKKYTVTNHNAKQAVTHFYVLERFKNYTKIELRLDTGRTHQIRVHMQYIGHPIVGDSMYGVRSKPNLDMAGQALHAQTLGFEHPCSGKQLLFQVPWPQDMKDALYLLHNC